MILHPANSCKFRGIEEEKTNKNKILNKTRKYFANQMDFIEQNNKQDVLTHLWLQYRGCVGNNWCSGSFVWWWIQFNHSIVCKCEEEEKQNILIFFSLACCI